MWNRALNQSEINTLYSGLVIVNGCTDPIACNYDSLATIDDSSCVYPSTSTDTVATCDSSYTWNDSTYTQSGTYTYSSSTNNNYSMSFDGVDDYIEIPDNNSLDPGQNNFTISTWIKFNSLGNDRAVIDYLDMSGISFARLNFRKNNLDQLHLSLKDDNGLYYTCMSSVTISDYNWHFLSVVFDYNNMTTNFYIDGQSVNSNITQSQLSVGINPGGIIQIGSYGGGANTLFTDAQISSIQVWHQTLTQQEIQNYMNCPPTGDESGLVGYWNFEEGSGTTTYDQTSNGNDGTINGATYDTSVPAQSCALTNVNGCDSTAILNLTINNAVNTSNTVSICSGDSFSVGTSTYNTDGTYTDILTTINGCDSTVTTVLTIDPLGCTDANAFNYDANAICDDGSCIAIVNGCMDSTACNYDSLANTDDGGCNYATTSTTNEVACNSFDWNGTTYGQSGTYSTNVGSDNNYSMSFNGVDDYVDCGFIQPNTTSLSISAWVYKNDSSNAGILTSYQSQNYGFGIYMNDLYFYLNLGGAWDGVNTNFTSSYLNQWVHVCGTWDGTTISLYINGSLVTSSPISGLLTYDNYFTIIGDLEGMTGWIWDGKIDDVSLWNTALSQTEIQQYMNCPPTGTEAGLVGYWNFEEGSGTTALDLTPNGNNGTINGATYDTNVPSQSCGLTNSNGCDSTAVLNLTINQADTSYTNITACDSVVWNGTTYDSSGTYSYSGSAVNNNYSMSFDGNDDYIDLGNSNDFDFSNSPLSIMCWVYMNNSSWVDGIISKNLSSNLGWWLASLSNDPALSHPNTFSFGGAASSGNYFAVYSPIILNDWVFLSSTHINGEQKLYVNGLLIDQSSHQYDLYNSATNLLIGKKIGDTYFDGLIDNISIWQTLLSQSEIQNYMNCPPTGNELGLVGYWNFEEGSGNTALDLSGNGNDGTINGSTYDANVPVQSCALTNANGCDSTAVLNLTINNSVFITDSVTICDGGSVSVGISIYDTIGSYIDTLQTANGCDSIINTVVDVMDVNIIQNDTAICFGDSITLSVGNANSSNACALPSNLQNGLVAYYPFCGNANDESGNNNHGIVYGATLTTDVNGNDSSAYYFDGNSKIEIAHDNSLNVSEMTLRIRFLSYNNPNATPNGNSLLLSKRESSGWGSSFEFYGESSFGSSWTLNGNGYLSGGSLTYGNWYDVVYVHASDSIKIYINNSLVSVSGSPGVYNSNSLPLTIGMRGNGWHEMIGKIDEIIIWNRTLITQEIEQLYNSQDAYSWSTGDTTASITVSPIQTTTYWVTQNGCTDSVTVTVNQPTYSTTNITACDSIVWNGTTYTQSGTYSSNIGSNSNYSMNFDGVDDNVTLPSNTLSGLTSFTYMTWFFAESGQTGFSDLIQQDNLASSTFWIRYYNGDSNFKAKFRIGGNANGVEVSPPPSFSVWHNFTVTWDGSTVTYYLDGIVQGTENMSGLYNGTEPIYIGNWQTQEGFLGKIDDISIWNTALSQQDIQSYMTCPPTGSESGLLGYWNFEEGIGTTALDQTPNGNNGTINGATYDTNVPTQSCALTNANGCDSTATLNLTINPSTSSTTAVTSCDSYDWNGQTYTSSSQYTWLGVNSNGCDSLATLNLTINPSTSSTTDVTACDSLVWNGQVINSSGNYTQILTNVFGCDSTHILVVTIFSSNAGSSSVTECDTYTWNGQVITGSGSYNQTFTNANGCDSVHTLVATINYSNTGTSAITACDSYLWNSQTITTSGNYDQTFTNVAGCDSTHTLVATINYSNTGTTSVTACDTYLWNAQTITSSGNYDQTFTNVAGCDSTHILVVTIDSSNTGTSSVTGCDSYSWNGQTITSSGNYNQTFTNVAGCDSTHTLIATIIFTTIIYDTISICKGESYVVSSSTYNNTGDYTDTIINSNGCLSIIYTNLTVASSLISSITQVGSVLESTVNGGFMPYSYLWNTLATTEDINITSSGLYWLVVTDSLSCPVDTAYYNGVLHTSISEIGISDLKVYPNPSRDIFNIVFSSNTIQNLDVRVINVIGEVIFSEDLDKFIGEYTKQINLKENAKGIYFLEIETNNGVINKKLILQ